MTANLETLLEATIVGMQNINLFITLYTAVLWNLLTFENR